MFNCFPSRHFQSAKLTGSIRYVDENGENQTQITAFVNLFKAKIPLFNGDKDGNSRFVFVQALPGRAS